MPQPAPTPGPCLDRPWSGVVEGQRLWNQLTKGMDGIYRVAEDYADMGLAGDPIPQLRDIEKRLAALIKRLEGE